MVTQADLAEAGAADLLRERLYGAIGCLGAVLALSTGYPPRSDVGAWEALADVAVTMGGLWAASLLSHYVAHVIVRGRGPRGRDALGVLRSTGQILQAGVLPLVLLAAAGLGWLSLPFALTAATWVLVLVLALFALLAARRLPVPGWQRAVFVVVLTGIGALVVLLKSH